MVTRVASTYRAQVAAARASYSPEKRRSEAATDPLSYGVYRPLSFWITPLFAAAGCSPTQATLVGLGLALAMPFAAAAGGLAGALAVATLALGVQVVDCVDGNLARMTGRTTVAGKFLDGQTSLVFWVAYFVAVGVLARGATGVIGRHAVELGLGLAVLLLLQRVLETTFDAWFREEVRWGPYLPPRAAHVDLSAAGAVLEQTYAFGGLLVASAIDRIDAFLAVMAVYQGALFLAWLPKFAVALRRRG